MIIRKIVQETKPMANAVKKALEKAAANSRGNVPQVQALKPKMTIKPSVAQTTFEEGLGANIIAEQNRSLVHQSRMQVGTCYYSPPSNIYEELLRSNSPTKYEQVKEIFHDRTGLEAHLIGDRLTITSTYNQESNLAGDYVLETIEKWKKMGWIPDDIGHVVIGHGTGSSVDNTWRFCDTWENVFDYAERTMKDGKKAIVFTCETEGVNTIPGKISVGHIVDSSFLSENLPPKIIKPGIREIIGHITPQGEIVPYRPELFK